MTEDARSRIAAARDKRRLQVHRLRMAVIAVAAALFIAAWAGIGAQMAAGRDPALGSGSSAVVTQSADPSVTSGDSFSPPADAPPQGAVDSGPSQGDAGVAAPVTTRQS
jgi:hypothetical protein